LTNNKICHRLVNAFIEKNMGNGWNKNIFWCEKSLLMQKLCCSLAATRGSSDCHDVEREEKIIVPFIFVYWGSRFHSKPFDPLRSTICSFRHHDANFIFVFWPGIKTILKSFRFYRYFSVFFYACDLVEIL